MSAGLPKYARFEHERRWLILGQGPDLTRSLGRLIEDLYIEGGRLRLRRVTFDDGRVELKLCKKYGSADPAGQPIVNVYLDDPEYRALAALVGCRLVKRRYSVPPFGVDIFEGALAGLRMCEAEADTAQDVAVIRPPDWAGSEVTGDPRFTGGELATLIEGDLRDLLRRFALENGASDGTRTRDLRRDRPAL